MVHTLPSRRWFLRLLAGAVLAAVLMPGSAVANDQPSAAPADWVRKYTPAQFLHLPACKAPINPADFRETLLAAAIFQETNRQRADLGLPAFLPDERAFDAARLHTRWMARTHTLSHDEISVQGAPVTALERLAQLGLRPHATAENIAYNLLPDIAPGRHFYTRLENGRPVYSYRPGGPPLRAHTYDDLARVIVAQWMHSPGHRANIVDPGLRFLGVGTALAHRRGHPDTIYGTQDFFTPRVPPSPFGIGAGEATLPPDGHGLNTARNALSAAGW